MNRTINELAARWLGREAATLSDPQSRALQSAIDRKPIARDTNADYAARQSAGDRIADAIARVGGSWSFIIGFLIFLTAWTAANVWLLGAEKFDPYPFVFLNLILSMVAALQAPVIMMSQNRQTARDRIDAAHDYEVNLKAEIEIMALHEKFEDLRHRELLMMRDALVELSSSVRAIEQKLSAAGEAPAG